MAVETGALPTPVPTGAAAYKHCTLRLQSAAACQTTRAPDVLKVVLLLGYLVDFIPYCHPPFLSPSLPLPDSIAPSFTGQGYIQYELRPAITFLTVRRQGGATLLSSGQTVISLGFVISKEDMSNTLFLLGSPDQMVEFISLEVRDNSHLWF